jgi:hypothetical protein
MMGETLGTLKLYEMLIDGEIVSSARYCKR